MQVSITQFRKDLLFTLVDQALEGAEIWVTHKGRRVRLTPETTKGNRLDRITPLQVINPDFPDLDDRPDKEEMQREWEESDWADL